MICDIVCFASEKYWKDREELGRSCEDIYARIGDLPGDGEKEESFRLCVITGTGELEALLADRAKLMVAIPFSGSVQGLVAEAAQAYENTVLYAAYVKGNTSEELSERLLYQNSAPALMDIWSVLKRMGTHVSLAVKAEELAQTLAVFRAYERVRGSKLLLIGETEPWVISASRDKSRYEALFGITVEQVDQEELVKLYEKTGRDQAGFYYDMFMGSDPEVVEPDTEDIWNACRMASALQELMEARGAQGGAIACFNLLKTGINTCLGVSFVNEHTEMSMACEGDLDSACTMLLMKQLAVTNLFMGNPSLNGDGTVNFSHCTAPCAMKPGMNGQYRLRNHHESGIGVSLSVDFPAGTPVTLCRLSGEQKQASVHTGVIVKRPYASCCRTQIHVQLHEYDHYLETVLGCHQVLMFEENKTQMEALFRLFGLKLC